jgi:hypothetical protein
MPARDRSERPDLGVKSLRPNAPRGAASITTPARASSEGNYGAYIEDLKRRKGPDADQPHRIKYKKLVRA